MNYRDYIDYAVALLRASKRSEESIQDMITILKWDTEKKLFETARKEEVNIEFWMNQRIFYLTGWVDAVRQYMADENSQQGQNPQQKELSKSEAEDFDKEFMKSVGIKFEE